MQLFENEIINISKIHTINMYETTKETAGKTTHYPVTLPTYELIFFFTEGGTTYFADSIIQDTANSIRYLPKGIKTGQYRVTDSKPGFCIDIYFDTSDPMPDHALGFKNMGELKNLFQKIYHIWNARKSGYYLEAMSILYDIIKKLKAHNSAYLSGSQANKIMPSYEYMMANFAKTDFDYHKMCAASGLSYDYFKDLFIAQYGVPPVKYVTRLRMEKARELLITQRYSVTEIAEMCGFENIYYFSTVFKKETGVPPTKYKTGI